MNALNKITWNRLRIAGLIGGVLVLLLLAAVVLVNVFTPADRSTRWVWSTLSGWRTWTSGEC